MQTHIQTEKNTEEHAILRCYYFMVKFNSKI